MNGLPCTSLSPVDYNAGWLDMAAAVTPHVVAVLPALISDVMRVSALGLCLRNIFSPSSCLKAVALSEIGASLQNFVWSLISPPPCPNKSLIPVEEMVEKRLEKVWDKVYLKSSLAQQPQAIYSSNSFGQMTTSEKPITEHESMFELDKTMLTKQYHQLQNEYNKLFSELNAEQQEFVQSAIAGSENLECYNSRACQLSEKLSSIANLPSEIATKLTKLSIFTSVSRRSSTVVMAAMAAIAGLFAAGQNAADAGDVSPLRLALGITGELSLAIVNKGAEALAEHSVKGLALFSAVDGFAKIKASIESTQEQELEANIVDAIVLGKVSNKFAMIRAML